MTLTASIPPTGYNVTVEPASLATPVDDPEISEVINLVTGEIRETKNFISSFRYDRFVAERVRIKESLAGKPAYACALCSTPVYIVCSPQKLFFFRHTHEDGSCRAQTRNSLTEEQIRARKYHGLRESEAHKRIKGLIERSLRADPAFISKSIESEKRWKAIGDPSLWRQPDVQAESADGRFAFEAQLSTTFLDVVVGRRMFYRNEGAMLVWVLGSFSPDYRRMTTDDLLFSNNSNVFVIDDETVALSEEKKRFHLHCHFRRPFRSGGAIAERWEEALVAFSDLVQDQQSQKVYFFDFDGEERRLKADLDQLLRDEFVAFWREVMNPHFDGKPASVARWAALKDHFSARKIRLPHEPSGDSSFRSLMHGVLSAVTGKPVGWQFDTLVQVAHHLAQSHRENLLAFGFALEEAGHRGLLKSQDMTGKWQRKRRQVWPLIQTRDPDYMPNTEWLPALTFLFPQVGDSIATFLKRDSVR